MSLEPTQIMIDFWLGGSSIDFDALTSIMGIIPTEIRRKESYKIPEFAKDSWRLSTGYQESMNVSDFFEQLVDCLIEKEDLINGIVKKYNLECLFIVVIKLEEDKRPEVILTRKCINFASNIAAEINFDLYY